MATVKCAFVALVAVVGVALAPAGGARPAAGTLSGTIVFVRFSPLVRHPRIYSLALAGGAAKPVQLPVLAAQGPALSPDGRELAFIAGTNPPNTTDVAGADALYSSRADGSGARRLTVGRLHVAAPTWSPDGKRIAFVRSAAKGHDSALAAVGVDHGRAVRLTHGNIDIEPSWAPDGRTIAFARIDAKTYQSGIWLVRADGSGLRRILPRFRNATEPVWSPDGARLLVEDGRALYSIRPDGGARRTIVRLTADANGNLEDPLAAWSPDGKWVVFCELRPGSFRRSDIWVVGADGRGLQRLTRSPQLDTDPSWAP